MPKDRDNDKLNEQEDLSLESILAEFGSKGKGEAPPPPQAPPPDQEGPDWREGTIPFPVKPKAPDQPPQPAGEKNTGKVTAFPGRKKVQAPVPTEEKPAEDEGEQEELPEKPAPEAHSAPEQEEEPPAAGEADKVLEFPPPQPENPVAAGLDLLRQKADDFAGHMFEEEGVEADPALRRAEKLIPGVDEEEEAPPPRTRRPRREEPPAPDLPPAALAKAYGKGLKGARVRTGLAALVTLLCIYLTLAETLPLPIPVPLAASPVLRCYALAGLQLAVILLGFDVFLKAFIRPFQFRMGLDLLMALGNLAVLADALTLPALSGGELGRQPLCTAACLTLLFTLWGSVRKRQAQRLACRTAASASEPYLVTRDEGKWNGRDTYVKWSGEPVGFGSQIQGPDGAEKVYRRFAPVLLCAAVLFSLISSLGRHRPQDILWCLGAILTAASPLSAALAYALPWKRLTRRLSQLGAALAGWEGVTGTTGSANLLLGDTDLFPPGAVSLNGVKVFGDVSIDKVVAVTATVIRDAGSGLDKVFHDLLRSQGATYRRGEQLTAYEAGGLSEVIRDELVLVGSAPFMVLMKVPLPPGLNVKNAVFCAIDGELRGIFALNYKLNGAVPYALDSLARNGVTPVLATRDFNIIPSMLRQRFKLPVDKLEFPPVERRRELSDPHQEHSNTLTAVLCREGVAPFAEAVVGARRLRTAVRLLAILACLGGTVGALLAFYLTFVGAYASLTAVNLMVFLLMWLVPAPLIAGWVDRY